MKYLLLIVFLVAVLITAGCVSGDKNTVVTPSPPTLTATITSTPTPRACIIDESQIGQIEILDVQYDFKGPDRSKRLVGKAKNVGTNTISGTITYTYYISKDSLPLERTEKIFKRSSVYKFCNIEPNQEFEFILEDIGLPRIEYQPEGCCLGSLDAGQKIVTTGEGPRW